MICNYIPMEDLLGHANTLKSIRNEVESKKQEEERQRQQQAVSQ